MGKSQSKVNSLTEAQLTELLDSIKDDDMKVIAKLLIEIKHENDREAEHAKRQSICSMVSCALCLILVSAILIWGVKFIPTVQTLATEATELVGNTNDLIADTNVIINQANDVLVEALGMVDETEAIIGQTTAIVDQTASIVDNLDKITTELAENDFNAMIKNIDSLVVASESSMIEAAEKLEAIDIESLNKAIGDLQAVISPLSKLFRR